MDRRTRGGPELQHGMHYSRTERLAAPAAPDQTPPARGFFRSNRGLLILLVDVAAIVLTVSVLRALGMLDPSTDAVGGRKFSARAYAVSDAVEVVVTVGRPSDADAPERRVYLRAFLSSTPEDFTARSVQGSADTVDVKLMLANPMGDTQAIVMVSLGSESVRLQARVR